MALCLEELRRKIKALSLIVLLLNQEVYTFRRNVDVHEASVRATEMLSRAYEFQNQEDLSNEGSLWNDLGRAAANADTDVRCSSASKELFVQSYDDIRSSMKGLADACAQAAQDGQTKCLGKGSGQNLPAIVRRAKRFQATMQQFSVCSWLTEVSKDRQSVNDLLVQSFDTIWQNAPELKKLRKKYPNLNFAGAYRKAASSTGSEEEVERNLLDSMRDLFGAAMPRDFKTDEALKKFKAKETTTVSTKSLLKDIDGNGKSKGADDMFLDAQPEFCRRFKTGMMPRMNLNSQSGCSNGGRRGVDSCFRFKAGAFQSETWNSTHLDQTADIITPAHIELIPQTAETTGVHAADGYLKNSPGKWGICLPKAGPNLKLTKMKGMASKVDEAIKTAVDSSGSLLQRAENSTITETEIGILLQIPAVIAMFSLVVVFFVVSIPICIAGSALFVASVILRILGPIGSFIGWIIFLPLCLIGGVLFLSFKLVIWLLLGLYGLGVFLQGGGRIWADPDDVWYDDLYGAGVPSAVSNAAEMCTLDFHMHVHFD